MDVDVGVHQVELGQGEQQLAPPRGRGRPYAVSPSIPDRLTHYGGEEPGGLGRQISPPLSVSSFSPAWVLVRRQVRWCDPGAG